MTLKEVLAEAKAKVQAGWTKGAYARNAYNVPVRSDEPTATCWCALGAVMGVKASGHVQIEAGNALKAAIGGDAERLTAWNDDPGRTQAEVVALFDKAIDGLP